MPGTTPSLPDTLGGFIYGLLVASTAFLVLAYATEGDIAGSFLLGGSAICAASATLLLSFRVYVRAMYAAPSPARGRTRARDGFLRGGPSIEASAERHSLHRLDGILRIRNPGVVPVRLEAVAVTRPEGCRVAAAPCGASGDAHPTTVTFGDSRVEIGTEVGGRGTGEFRVHVLLPDGQTAVRDLDVEAWLSRSDHRPKRHRVRLKAPA